MISDVVTAFALKDVQTDVIAILQKEQQMIKLSAWEQFVIGAGVSLLTFLSSKITNATELAAAQAAIDFLNKLLAGSVSTS